MNNEQTGIITDEMMKGLGDMICVAPWTELDLTCVFENENNKEEKVWINVIMVQIR